MSSLVHSFNTSTACVQRFHSEEILSESAKILREIPNASTVERFRLVTSYMLHARMQPNVVDVVRMKIIKVFFIQNCAHDYTSTAPYVGTAPRAMATCTASEDILRRTLASAATPMMNVDA